MAVAVFMKMVRIGITRAFGLRSEKRIAEAEPLRENNPMLKFKKSIFGISLLLILSSSCIIKKKSIIIEPEERYFTLEGYVKNLALIQMNDFFPLSIGSRWVYTYHLNQNHLNYVSRTSGQLTWEVTSYTENKYEICYYLKGYKWFCEGCNSIPAGMDSTFVDEKYCPYNILINSTASNYFIDFTNLPGFYDSRDWLNINIVRYHSPAEGDTLYLSSGEYPKQMNSFKAKYVKNIGLVSLEYFGTSYHTTDRVEYKLMEHSIK
jgi:hypothetical protein